MSELIQNTKRAARSIFGDGDLPPPQAVFFVIMIVSLFQIPTHLLMRRGFMAESILINELLAVFAVPIFLSYAFHYDLAKLFPLKAPKLSVVILAIIATVAADLTMEYLTVMSEWILPLPEKFKLAIDNLMTVKGPLDLATKLALLCALPGICEEFLFRGFCQGALSQRWGKAVGLFIASVLFSLLHGNPWYFHLYVLLGLFFGAMYLVTGTLVVPIICHVFNNCWSIAGHNLGLRPLQSGNFAILDVALLALAPLVIFACISICYKMSQNKA